MIGNRIGPYEITAKLGEGGMGEVYRATDGKLKREVAIKLLPAAFTEDEARLARFEREAQLLAQLHHPHIASIFGLEESSGVRALVMELVEGPTLADRLARGPLLLEEALVVARQIAEALEEAHGKGIIHRDLKPQNVKAPVDGPVKVLDFGLAKALDPVGAASGDAFASQLAASPTLTLGATVQGVLLGTAAYMAPEQAKGGAVDKRADIWAFGVVLWEMLTGRRLFEGDSAADTLAGVLRADIDLTELPGETPAAIRRLLRRCLERQPRNRLHDIADARIVLDEVLAGTSQEPSLGAVRAPSPSRRASVAAMVAAALLGAGLGYLFATVGSAPAPADAAERRFVIDAADRSMHDRQAIAPDGGRIAYTAGGELWLRLLAEVEPRRIAGGDGAREPFWSPDGREVGFVREGALWRLGTEGGTARRICELPVGIFDGGSWGDDGAVVFAVAAGGWTATLYQCPAAGGDARTLLAPEVIGSRWMRPQALPQGAGVLYAVDTISTMGEIRILESGRARVVLRAASRVASAVLSPDRTLYFALARQPGWDLWSVALDERLEKTRGEPELLAQGGVYPSVARDGALLFSLSESPPRRLALVARDGSIQPIGEPFRGDVESDTFQLSPDGTRATMLLPDTGRRGSQIWIVELASGARRPLSDGFEDPLAAWSPDGRELLVSGQDRGAVILPMSGGGATRELAPGHAMFQARFAPDGEWIVYYAVTPESGRDLFRIAADGRSEPEPLVREPGQQANPDLSPDGRLLAYQSDESGRPEIYVRAYPTGERKWQVSTGGGASPIWNRQGGELVWVADNAIWSAPASTADGSFEAGAPRLLVRGDAIGADLESGSIFYSRMLDLSNDGRSFLVAQSAGEGRNEIVYVENPGGRKAPAP
jgi:Tol biopolymer transport system component